MKLKLDLSKKDIKYSIILILTGIFLGWLIFGRTANKAENANQVSTHQTSNWTCSMHPQIKQDKPGQCPICGMDLVPLGGDSEEDSTVHLQMTETAMKIAEVQTTIVKKTIPFKEIYFSGKVKVDERKISKLTARFPGRIEKLSVNFTGQRVSKGRALATIYSPELVTSQKELFEAIKYKDSNPQFYVAVRNKLKLWDLSEKQIDDIENNGEPQFYFEILSPLTGTVTIRHITLGELLKEGDPLFEIVDLRHIWVMFDAYESDIPWVKPGDKVAFTIQSLPGRSFTGKITFIDPVINPETRVALLRTELNNPKELLKPGMFARGLLKTSLHGVDSALIVPKSAVLWTGKRAVVYIKDPQKAKPTFRYREIVLGEDTGDYYVVKEGLEEGEEIVTNGVFKIDAASQLQGKVSMMNKKSY
ncbi:MAG: efflux RND transporter periplasmic adaptor subunit [Cytophagales bacterium]|nr:efflux RND transporter periplasmic adaptor subunit [Cytophagales bacterium]